MPPPSICMKPYCVLGAGANRLPWVTDSYEGTQTRSVHLLLIEELHIMADGIDCTHEEATGCTVDEVLVLSRHVSATEIPALTLHAIGIPGETPHGERGQAGGRKGSVVPPSPRFASLFRSMLSLARLRETRRGV